MFKRILSYICRRPTPNKTDIEYDVGDFCTIDAPPSSSASSSCTSSPKDYSHLECMLCTTIIAVEEVSDTYGCANCNAYVCTKCVTTKCRWLYTCAVNSVLSSHCVSVLGCTAHAYHGDHITYLCDQCDFAEFEVNKTTGRWSLVYEEENDTDDEEKDKIEEDDEDDNNNQQEQQAIPYLPALLLPPSVIISNGSELIESVLSNRKPRKTFIDMKSMVEAKLHTIDVDPAQRK